VLKPVDKSWQPADFLPQSSDADFVDQVSTGFRRLAARCFVVPTWRRRIVLVAGWLDCVLSAAIFVELSSIGLELAEFDAGVCADIDMHARNTVIGRRVLCITTFH